MSILGTIGLVTKFFGFAGTLVKDLRKQKLDYELEAAKSQNQRDKDENTHKAKVIGMQLDDIQHARENSAGLPEGIVCCMVIAASAATGWFVIAISRSLYRYAQINQLDIEIMGLVKLIFGFMFGGAAGIVMINQYRKK